MCESFGCTDNIMDFTDSGLTFEIRDDSVFYYPFVNSPDVMDKFAIESYSKNLLQLRNASGLWNFEIDEIESSSMKITAIVPSNTGADVVYYDIISLVK
jgi:hypothetical protein